MAGIAKVRLFPLEASYGDGCWLVEPSGRRLLDLKASASSLGHGHPTIVDAITRASRNPPGASSLSAAVPDSVALAEELLEIVPGTDNRRVYLGHSGSDANEVAVRVSRHASARRGVVAFEHSYHGGLGLARTVSGFQVASGTEPDSGVIFVPYPGAPVSTSREGARRKISAATSLAAVESALAPRDTACLIVEPLLCDGGVLIPPAGFLRELKALCERYGTLLICDEVKVGLGRTGLLHAFQSDDVRPDLVTFGKSLGGGLPLAAVVGPGFVLDEPAASALLTTAGNPICAAAGRATLRTIVDEGLSDAAAERGLQLRTTLRELLAVHPAARDCVADVRGRGLTTGIEITDHSDGTIARDLVRKTCFRAWQLGAVVGYVAGSVVELSPPLTISPAEVETAAAIVTQAVVDAASGAVADEEIRPYSGW